MLFKSLSISEWELLPWLPEVKLKIHISMTEDAQVSAGESWSAHLQRTPAQHFGLLWRKAEYSDKKKSMVHEQSSSYACGHIYSLFEEGASKIPAEYVLKV